ncbi:adenylosuccinate lyase family protein [Jannaschia sp. Os4]|uniref:lyase family protein n=1 Tax=Jannaschia sp. Os4 TaxID=2807617 RepID=UPI00193969E0|nr:lyase family protein [Jannaschia sp. Os4]MBM2575972.1 adenylosuccinate lyase family protein [Jannaschia sp. Os4]
MTATPFDSPIFSKLLGDAELGHLFSATAEVRAMLIFEGALAKAQGEVGMIPETAGAFLHRASMEVQVDPAGLAEGTAANGIPVPALVAAFRAACNAPEYAPYAHWGATTQDVVDTALALRLRQALAILETRLDALLDRLAALAEAHAETPMAARTWGQVATPTTFGATVATWGEGLLAVRGELKDVRHATCILTLNGAAGTLGAMGTDGPAVRSKLATALGLRAPQRSPHADRSHTLRLAGWCARVLAASAKMATDLLLLARDGEVAVAGGSSSTMPQKANPVGPSVVRALHAHGAGLNATLQATTHWDARDGGAWMAEWLALPQLVIAAGRALAAADAEVTVDAALMRARVDDPTGLIHAEALSFDMARTMPRPEAQARVKAWAAEVRVEGGSLLDRAGADPADYAPERRWGEAPALARRFAAKVRGGPQEPA